MRADGGRAVGGRACGRQAEVTVLREVGGAALTLPAWPCGGALFSLWCCSGSGAYDQQQSWVHYDYIALDAYFYESFLCQ